MGLEGTAIANDKLSQNDSYLNNSSNISRTSTCRSQKRHQDSMQNIQAFLEDKYPIDPKRSVLVQTIKELLETEEIFIRYKKDKMQLGKTKDSIVKTIVEARRLRFLRKAKNKTTATITSL